jgi:hypothetical protein
VWDLVEPSTERCIAPLAFVGCVSGLGGSRAARTHCLPTLPGMPSTYNSNPDRSGLVPPLRIPALRSELLPRRPSAKPTSLATPPRPRYEAEPQPGQGCGTDEKGEACDAELAHEGDDSRDRCVRTHLHRSSSRTKTQDTRSSSRNDRPWYVPPDTPREITTAASP